MTEPLQPDDIARRDFEVTRRGYDQHAVRGFLHEISGQLTRLQAVERDLQERLSRAEARLQLNEHPDEAAMLEVLGEETTRVLTSAREAAAEIRSKAEQSAERIIAEATAQAAATRAGAVTEADNRLADAKAEAEQLLSAARGELERRTKEATEAADRIRAEGARLAQATRDEAQRTLEAATEQAAGIVEAAKAEGRQLVTDAQTVREQVLRDLAARRRKARQQIEQLNAGRERLLEAYDVVRSTIDTATGELAASVIDARAAAAAAARRVAVESDPSFEELGEELAAAHLADLPITATRVAPLAQVPKGRREREEAAAAAAPPVPPLLPVEDERPSPPAAPSPPAPPTRRPPAASDFDPMPAPAPGPARPRPRLVEPEHVDAQPATTEPATTGPAATDPVTAEPSQDAPPPEPEPVEEPAAEVSAPVEEPAAEVPAPVEAGPIATQVDAPAAAPQPEPRPSAEPVPIPEATPEAAAAAEPSDDPVTPPAEAPAAVADLPDAPVPEPAAGRPADSVFARLHAAVGSEAEAAAPSEPEPEPTAEAEASPQTRAFHDRAAALEPLQRDLAKRLKRALADEQNEVLDQLRRGKPAGIDDLLPTADDHAARWADAAVGALRDAADAGARWSGGSARPTGDLTDDLARSLVLPLRERIDRSFVASDGNLDDVADRVRALYREWKNQRLPEAVPHYVAAAYARGVLDAAPAEAQVQWVPDPDQAACPDCGDNVLAGPIAKGEEFPTGDRCAPAHPGCRCLVLPLTA